MVFPLSVTLCVGCVAMAVVGVDLADLPWDDVIFHHILPQLSVKDLCRLRGVSKRYHQMMDAYLASCKKLSFYESNISDEQFSKVVENCVGLQVLCVAGCRRLSDSALVPVFRNNSNLLHVDMCSCPQLSGAALQTLVVHCKKVESLMLADCPWFGCGCLQVVTVHLSELKRIDISGCWDLDMEVIEQFFMKFPGLQDVSLRRFEYVSDMNLYHLASNCRGLQTLNVSKCWRITDKGLRKVVDLCPRLRVLNVRACHGLTEKYLCSLIARGIKVICEYSLEEMIKRRKQSLQEDGKLQKMGMHPAINSLGL